MLEVNGSLWDYSKNDQWVVVTTNGTVKKDGAAVPDTGIAKQAFARYPALDKELGNRVKCGGNNCNVFSHYKVITLPIKNRFMDAPDFTLIKRSLVQLQSIVVNLNLKKIYIPVINGSLDWETEARPLLVGLSDRFVVVNPTFEPSLRRFKGFVFKDVEEAVEGG